MSLSVATCEFEDCDFYVSVGTQLANYNYEKSLAAEKRGNLRRIKMKSCGKRLRDRNSHIYVTQIANFMSASAIVEGGCKSTRSVYSVSPRLGGTSYDSYILADIKPRPCGFCCDNLCTFYFTRHMKPLGRFLDDYDHVVQLQQDLHHSPYLGKQETMRNVVHFANKSFGTGGHIDNLYFDRSVYDWSRVNSRDGYSMDDFVYLLTNPVFFHYSGSYTTFMRDKCLYSGLRYTHLVQQQVSHLFQLLRGHVYHGGLYCYKLPYSVKPHMLKSMIYDPVAVSVAYHFQPYIRNIDFDFCFYMIGEPIKVKPQMMGWLKRYLFKRTVRAGFNTALSYVSLDSIKDLCSQIYETINHYIRLFREHVEAACSAAFESLHGVINMIAVGVQSLLIAFKGFAVSGFTIIDKLYRWWFPETSEVQESDVLLEEDSDSDRDYMTINDPHQDRQVFVPQVVDGDEDEVVEGKEQGSITKIFAFLCHVVGTVFEDVICAFTEVKKLDLGFKRLMDFVRSCASVGTTYDLLTGSITRIVDWIYELFFGEPYSNKAKLGKKINQLSDNLALLHDEFCNLPVGSPASQEMMDKVKLYGKQVENINLQLIASNVPINMRSLFKNTMDSMSTKIRSCELLCAQWTTRMQPVVVFLHGLGNSGKSQVVKALPRLVFNHIAQYCAFADIENPWQDICKEQLNIRISCNSFPEYFETYNNHISVTLEEIYSSKISETNIQWSDTLFSWANPYSVLLNTAFQDKGTKNMIADLIICVSNDPGHQIVQVDPGAYHRRIDFDLTVSSEFVEGSTPYNATSYILTGDAVDRLPDDSRIPLPLEARPFVERQTLKFLVQQISSLMLKRKMELITAPFIDLADIEPLHEEDRFSYAFEDFLPSELVPRIDKESYDKELYAKAIAHRKAVVEAATEARKKTAYNILPSKYVKRMRGYRNLRIKPQALTLRERAESALALLEKDDDWFQGTSDQKFNYYLAIRCDEEGFMDSIMAKAFGDNNAFKQSDLDDRFNMQYPMNYLVNTWLGTVYTSNEALTYANRALDYLWDGPFGHGFLETSLGISFAALRTYGDGPAVYLNELSFDKRTAHLKWQGMDHEATFTMDQVVKGRSFVSQTLEILDALLLIYMHKDWSWNDTTCVLPTNPGHNPFYYLWCKQGLSLLDHVKCNVMWWPKYINEIASSAVACGYYNDPVLLKNIVKMFGDTKFIQAFKQSISTYFFDDWDKDSIATKPFVFKIPGFRNQDWVKSAMIAGASMTLISAATLLFAKIYPKKTYDSQSATISHVSKDKPHNTRHKVMLRKLEKAQRVSAPKNVEHVVSPQMHVTHSMFKKIAANIYMIRNPAPKEFIPGYATFLAGTIAIFNKHVWRSLDDEFYLFCLSGEKYQTYSKHTCKVLYDPPDKDLVYVMMRSAFPHKNIVKYCLNDMAAYKSWTTSTSAFQYRAELVTLPGGEMDVQSSWNTVAPMTSANKRKYLFDSNHAMQDYVYFQTYGANSKGDCGIPYTGEFANAPVFFGAHAAGNGHGQGCILVAPVLKDDFEKALSCLNDSDKAFNCVSNQTREDYGLFEVQAADFISSPVHVTPYGKTVFVKTPLAHCNIPEIPLLESPANLGPEAYFQARTKGEKYSNCRNAHPRVVSFIDEYSQELCHNINVVSHNAENRELDFLDSKTAIWGDPDLGVPALKFDTSRGQRCKLLNINKNAAIDPNSDAAEQLLDVVDHLWEQQEEGKFNHVIAADALKDELRDHERVEAKKTRIFYVVDFVDNILLRMILYPLFAVYGKTFGLHSHACGINPMSGTWRYVHETFANYLSVVCADVEGFDYLGGPVLGPLIVRYISMFYPQAVRDSLTLRRIAWAIAAYFHCIRFGPEKRSKFKRRNGFVVGYHLGHGGPSGSIMTTFMNTLIHDFMMCICFMFMMQDFEGRMDFSELLSFKRIIYSDDNISASKYSWWTIDNYAFYIKEYFGGTITAADKTLNFKRITINEAEFLSRSFLLTEGFSVRAPLKVESLFSQIYYVRRLTHGETTYSYLLNQLQINLDNVSRELRHYPYDEAEKYWLAMEKCVLHLKLPVKINRYTYIECQEFSLEY